MPGEEVRYERVGAAGVLTIDRPARRNAIDGPTAEALAAAHAAFAADDGARVLVVTGAGGVSFCAGADLKALERLGPRLAGGVRLLGLTRRLAGRAGPLGFPRRIALKPAIAAIEGWCLAGGLELALWCDLRIATEGSTFGCTERRFGVPLVDGGTQALPRARPHPHRPARRRGGGAGARARHRGRRGGPPSPRPRARDRRGPRGV